ncbi:MAG TPA: hypothetical protein VF680_11895 [Allosphingosinicella sp.]
MKGLLGVGGSGMLLAGLYAGDALTAGQVYDVPLEQAFSELSAMPVPDALTHAAIAADTPDVAVRRSAGAIDWQFQVRGQNVAAFTARLSAEGPKRTRVRIEYTPGEPATPELRQLTSASLVRELARLAMSEQVDAQLERRPVDQQAIVDALARHAAAHPEQVQDFGRATGEMALGLYQQANENSRGVAAPTDY